QRQIYLVECDYTSAAMKPMPLSVDVVFDRQNVTQLPSGDVVSGSYRATLAGCPLHGWGVDPTSAIRALAREVDDWITDLETDLEELPGRSSQPEDGILVETLCSLRRHGQLADALAAAAGEPALADDAPVPIVSSRSRENRPDSELSPLLAALRKRG